MCGSVEFVPRYIKTSGNATVDHLSKYLALRIALEERQRDSQSDAAMEKGKEGVEAGAKGEKSAGGASLKNVSEKQYTIYITTSGGQFSVSTQAYPFSFFSGWELLSVTIIRSHTSVTGLIFLSPSSQLYFCSIFLPTIPFDLFSSLTFLCTSFSDSERLPDFRAGE